MAEDLPPTPKHVQEIISLREKARNSINNPAQDSSLTGCDLCPIRFINRVAQVECSREGSLRHWCSGYYR